MPKLLFCGLLIWAASSTSLSAQGDDRRTRSSLPNYDYRDLVLTDESSSTVIAHRAITSQRLAAVERHRARLRRSLPELQVSVGRYGLPKVMSGGGRALSGKSARAPEDIARDFLRANGDVFGLSGQEIDGLRLLVKDAAEGAVFLVFNQTVNGIDVFNGQIKFTLTAAGEIVMVGIGDVAPGLDVPATPRLNAEQAVRAAFLSFGKGAGQALGAAPEAGPAAFRNPFDSHYSPITAEMQVFPLTAASGLPAWRIFVEAGSESAYEVLIDADSGRVLLRHNRIQRAVALGRVWVKTPAEGRQLVTFPNDWLPATVTTGNNVDAYLDANGNDRPDTLSGPDFSNGRAYSVYRRFDFAYGDALTSQDPRDFPAASVTSLFYFVNVAHDYFYGLGFTEPAGNMQTSNFGRDGDENDAVIAQAQSGNVTNSASSISTPDGRPPKLRLGLFKRTTANQTGYLDSDIEGQAVLHEYTHLVTNRIVGGRTSTSCLAGIQSLAMGEGWSDYFAISFFNNPIMDAYLAQDPQKGLRRASYEGYPLTYEDFGNTGYEVHDDGEIWAATLWDLRKGLGASVVDKLVMNGLKSTPCGPSMTDARDAILAADRATNAGANRAAIWRTFSKHGLGFSAAGTDGSLLTGTVHNAAFDLPSDLQGTKNPAITSSPLQTIPSMGDLYSYTVTATNPAGGTLNFALAASPVGMTIDSTSGTIRWTAAFAESRVKMNVTDGKGGRVVHGFLLPVVTRLTPGTAVSVGAGQGNTGWARVNVPAGTPVLQVTLRDGTGNADLALVDPTGAVVGRSERAGNTETLAVPMPMAGPWWVSVYGYRGAFSAVSLSANLITPTVVQPNVVMPGLSGVVSSESYYRVTVPAGATAFAVSTTGGTGNVDLFVRYRQPAVCQAEAFVMTTSGLIPSVGIDETCYYDASSTNNGNSEYTEFTCYLYGVTKVTSDCLAGDWYIALSGFQDYSGVTLKAVTASPPTLSLSAATPVLVFTAGEGGAAPAAQNLSISGGTSTYNWGVQATTTSGGGWLKLSKTSGTGDATLQVTVDQTGLAQGDYRGTITVTAIGVAGSPQTYAVTLTVTARPALSVATTTLTFGTVLGENAPSQNLAVSNAGGGTLAWTATASTAAGGNWLSVSPASGTGSASIQVSVTTASLAVGSYNGTITIAASGATGSPKTVAVSLVILAPSPVISTGGVVGAAGSSPALLDISPGAMVNVFGQMFAPQGTARTVGDSDLVDGSLPTKLAGVCVLVNDTPGFLTFVSPTQVTFQAPKVPTLQDVDVRVYSDCGGANELRSPPVRVRSLDATPEFLYWLKSADGKHPVMAADAVTWARIGPEGAPPDLALSPAKPGDVVTIVGVSFGPTDPPVDPGRAAAGTAPLLVAPDVTLGTLALSPGDILYAGAAPGAVGQYQLTIRIPADLADGYHPIAMSIATYKTPVGYLAVKK